MKIIREQLKKARKDIGATQAEFSEIIDISVDHYIKIEHGHANPSIPVFLRMCKTLKKPAQYFFAISTPYLTEEQFKQLMECDKKDLETLLSILQALYEKQNINDSPDIINS